MKDSSETSSSSSTTECGICGLVVDPFGPATWKEVAGWVGGPKKDSMRLRHDTNRFAHDGCVKKLAEGQAVDQPDMFDADLDQAMDNVFGPDLPEELQ